MRRHWVVALAVLTLLGVLSPPALAQAPAPKVTITGLVDNLVNFNRNASINDIALGGITRTGDNEFYGRTRGRFDIIGELGKAKAVVGLEVDLVYGQVNGGTGGAAQPCVSGALGSARAVTTCGFAADNDTVGVIEFKWMYVDFPLTGPGSLLPMIPFAGSMQVGGQPYALGLAPSILADSDFPGATIRMTFSPTLKGSLTYAQLEDSLTGTLGFPNTAGGVASPAGVNRFGRGDDWGIILKADWQATKELRVSPIYAFQEIAGTTSVFIRRATGGYGVTSAAFAPDQGTAPAPFAQPAIVACNQAGGVSSSRCQDTHEWRQWIGADARWARGPWYVAPTFFYQWGDRQRFPVAGGGATNEPGVHGANPHRLTAHESAWIGDVAGGYRVGPLFLQLRALYTSGNKARDNLNNEIRYYQPFQTGNSFYTGWSEVSRGTTDYLTTLYGSSNTFTEQANIGYDRYGRAQVTAKASYDITPTITPSLIVTPMWTARQVPTERGFLTTTGILCVDRDPAAAVNGTTHVCDRADKGNDSYLGTEVAVGFTYRFAPGLRFDWVYGLLVPGPAYDTNRFGTLTGAGVGVPGTVKKFDAENVYTTTARVRYQF